MKFGILVQNSIPITAIWSNSKPEEEFQYGCLLFFQIRNGYIAAAD